MGILNQIIVDTDLDVSKLLNGKEISRQRKRKNILNDQRRAKLKYQLVRGTFTPLQYLEAISNTIGKMKDYF